MERKPSKGVSRSGIPCDRKGSSPEVANKIINRVNGGFLTPCHLKHLSKKQIKTAIALGKLPFSVLNEEVLEITRSEIIHDIAVGILPPEALYALSPNELREAIDEGEVSLLVKKRKSRQSADRSPCASKNSSQYRIELREGIVPCCSRNRFTEIEEVKRAVAKGLMPPSALWEKAGLLPSDVIADVRDGVLPEIVLKSLEPDDLLEAIKEGILDPSVLKNIRPEFLIQAIVEEKIPYCVVQAVKFSPFDIPSGCCEYNPGSRSLPSSFISNNFTPEDMEPERPSYIPNVDTNSEVNQLVSRHQETLEPSEPTRENKLSRDMNFIRDQGFPAESHVLSPTPSSDTDLVHVKFSHDLQQAVETGLVTLSVTRRAETDEDVEFIKKAVKDGYLPPSALKEKAGLTANEIARAVADNYLPSSALEALSLEEIREEVYNGTLPSYLVTKLPSS